MLELLRIFLPTLARLFRKQHDHLAENLLLRHQLRVALRSRPRPDLKTRDRLFWLLVRSAHRDWRRHLILVQSANRPPLAPTRLAALLALALRQTPVPASIERRKSRTEPD